MIRTCLFDLGNVLLHFCHDRMCGQMGALCGRTGGEVRELLIASGVQLDFERGRHSEDQFHGWFEQQVGAAVAIDALRHAASDIFTLNAPMPAILDSLRSQGIRLVLLSNTSAYHFEFIRQNFDVLGRFDAFVLSYEVGAVKPEPAIFEAALKAIRCEPHECFYTDDIPTYIDTARRYGLQAEVFTDAAELRRQLSARGLSVP